MKYKNLLRRIAQKDCLSENNVTLYYNVTYNVTYLMLH